MKSWKPYVILLAALFTVVLVLPTLLVIPFTSEVDNSHSVQQPSKSQPELGDDVVEVAVYRSNAKTIENVRLEEYVKGVVASEMPAEFEIEALKAQALTARTYIVKQMLSDNAVGLPEGAMVTDTIMHQVYKSPEELKGIWGTDYQWKMDRIHEAVQATRGQVITYEGHPITASFFSTSNGYTENSEDYWQNPFPYLRSVESPWDKNSPKFSAVKVFPIQEFENLLGVKLGADTSVGKVIAQTEGQRIAKIQINNKVFTGRDIRTKLSLNSSDFSLSREGDKIVAKTRGWGHGVGMSQYGANGMASEGSEAPDIIAHYYQGTNISSMTPFTTKWVVKK
ncbi:stage II sporulation protein D [Bacillus solimangrovi]|uniref:Stage II sporulation protein D n=1 Tax=Bacillus solimangrovi TaxID=1305675 RepID=A0A1E5LGW9_9BACI|nr:stage II sporulation protein D [Bacillus solimangrovi]OEH93331.1 stage II sporulation protein D [Bacillus solimangrovi]